MTINEAMRTYRLPNPTTPEDLETRWSKVLTFGDKAEIISPEEYREGFSELLKSIGEKYSDERNK